MSYIHDLELDTMRSSHLLRLGVKEAIRAENEGQELDMETWVESKDDGTCKLCLAGSIMKNRQFIDSEPNGVNEWAFRLDDMRQGFLTDVGDYSIENMFRSIVMTTWNDEIGRSAWQTYLDAADYLESCNL